MFTANVSLVPCAISHNPLPQCQEPVLGYCPPHLFCIASRPQHFLFSFIFGQLFSIFHPPRFFLWLFSTSTFTFILLLSFTFLIFFSITLFSVNWTPEWNYNNLKSKIFQFPNLSSFFHSQPLIDGCRAPQNSLQMENKEIALLCSSDTYSHSLPSSHSHPSLSAGSCLGRRAAVFLWAQEEASLSWFQ